MENQEKNKKIYKYLIFAFFVMFIGAGLFLLFNRSKPIPEKISTVKVPAPSETEKIPTISAGSMTLETDLPNGQMKVGDIVELSLYADSAEKNIVGYDVVISYDSVAFDFLRGLSSLPDYNIFTYKKDHSFIITGLKRLQSAPSPMTKATKLATLTFEATKVGKFEFILKSSIGKDRTDLITDKTEVLVPLLNQAMVAVE